MPKEKNSNDKGKERNIKMPESIEKKNLFFSLRQKQHLFIFLTAVAADLLVFTKHDFCNEVC